MRITACNQIFEGSPETIVGQLRELLVDQTVAPDAESYIKHIQRTFKLIIDEDMVIPDGTLDERIRAMFAHMENIDILEVLDE